MERSANVKTWLAENGFNEVLAMIEGQEHAWAEQGKKTRRNWWDVLAGGKGGRPKVIGGAEFPVLRAAQERMQREVTENALGAPAPALRIVEAAPEIEPEPVLCDAPELLPAVAAEPRAVIVERR